jgi:hypothetical protein
MMRTITSMPLPGGQATMMVTGRFGNSWARAGVASAAVPRISRLRLFMVSSLCRLWCVHQVALGGGG